MLMNETQVIESLSRLGFFEDCIVETIMVTLNENGSPNPAPMGVKRCGGTLIVTAYKTSQTYGNLRRGGAVSINLTNDPLLFLVTAFKNEIEEQPVTEEMYVEGADAVIQMEIRGQVNDYELKADIELLPRGIDFKSPHPYVFSRGRSEAIEAIIHATRIKVFHEDNRDKKVQNLVDQVRDCIATINKVSAEGSVEAEVALTLESLIKKWGVQW
jgi:hypothetical protein